MRRQSFPFIVLFVLSLAASAAAQQTEQHGRTGFTLGTGGVGFVFHLTDSFAIRPTVGFGFGSSENQREGATVNTTSNGSFGPAVSALFYVRTWDRLRTYVAPAFAYSRSTTHSESGGATSDATTNNYSGSGSIGVEYGLGRRFAVFAQVGAVYGRTSGSGTSTLTSAVVASASSVTHSHSWGTTGAIFGAVYF